VLFTNERTWQACQLGGGDDFDILCEWVAMLHWCDDIRLFQFQVVHGGPEAFGQRGGAGELDLEAYQVLAAIGDRD